MTAHDQIRAFAGEFQRDLYWTGFALEWERVRAASDASMTEHLAYLEGFARACSIALTADPERARPHRAEVCAIVANAAASLWHALKVVRAPNVESMIATYRAAIEAKRDAFET